MKGCEILDIRYASNPADIKRYTTSELRSEFLIQDLYAADTVRMVYSHVDRMVTIGVMPVNEVVTIDQNEDIQKSFGVDSFFERREAGFFNLGGSGECSVDDETFPMGYKDCLYITKGAKNVKFKSTQTKNPARFYGVSAPAHAAYKTRAIYLADAAKKPLGSAETANERVVNQFIHPDVLKTCQLTMGLTELKAGSVWNTMPAHTHERRMEIYTYFDISEGSVVFHFMGRPDETRHIVMRNFDAVISPSWSIHSGCGCGSYTFIWAMGGENQTFEDMDELSPKDLL